MTAAPSLRADQPVCVSRHVHFREFDDETVLIDLAGGEYFSLNEVGTKVWRALAEGDTPGQIAARLCSEYDVESSVILADCLQLVCQLVARGLVSPA